MRAAFPFTFYFTIAIILKQVSTQRPPELTVSYGSQQKKVRPNTNIILECPVRNQGDLIFEWYKDKESLMTFGGHRLKTLSNGSLRIKETVFDDTGVYRCRAVNGFGSVEYNITLLVIGNEEDYEQYETIYGADDLMTDDSKITLTSRPSILYVTDEKSPIYKPLGSTFMLQCVAIGFPKPEVMWYKDGVPVSKLYRMGRWALKFTKAMSTDTGNYTCVASNILGRASHSFVLEVDEPGRKARGKPLITGFNRTVEEGQLAVMECGVESATLPHLEWLKQVNVESQYLKPGNSTIEIEGEYFKVLTVSTDYLLKDGIYYLKLMIDDAQPEDAGKYICGAANTYGYNFQFTYLDVIPKRSEFQSSISFPIVVTVIVVAVAVLGCIFALLFYCRPKRTRTCENSVEVPMVTKEGFIPMRSGQTNSLKSTPKVKNGRSTHPVTYVTGLSNGVL